MATERSLKLACFRIGGPSPALRPALSKREWMEATPAHFANRCLPLLIANAYGWEIVLSHQVTATWGGGDGLEAISIETDGPNETRPAYHFGHGILTFHVNLLIRTEPGYNLFVSGPLNAPKDGIAPLTGIVETDWAPYTFTMNWKFTRPNFRICFHAGEPFCQFFPIRRGELERFEPEVHSIEDDPDLHTAYYAWRLSRQHFNANLRMPGSSAQAERWQKSYFRGDWPDGRHFDEHQTSLPLSSFPKL